jgi:uncharacterized protein DUF4149
MRATARGSAGLAAAWAGVLLCIAAMAAPSAFALLSRADAGRYVGRLFAEEAYLSLGLGLLLFFVERRRARIAAEAGAGSIFSIAMVMLLGTIFCTVAGWFAVEPMMAAARLGQGAWSFGALHAVSGGFYLLKFVLVTALAWRFSRL